MARLILLVTAVLLLCIVLATASVGKCTVEEKANITSCFARNKKLIENMKIEGYEGEEHEQKILIFTCYQNIGCFENRTHCDGRGRLSNVQTCRNMEMTMEPEFKQCLALMDNVQDECVRLFMTSFMSRTGNEKFRCATYQKFCAREFIAEKCALGVVDQFDTILDHLMYAKRCEKFH